jgi:hypothetical protein
MWTRNGALSLCFSRICATPSEVGIEFLSENGGGPGVRLARRSGET